MRSAADTGLPALSGDFDFAAVDAIGLTFHEGPALFGPRVEYDRGGATSQSPRGATVRPHRARTGIFDSSIARLGGFLGRLLHGTPPPASATVPGASTRRHGRAG